MTQTIQRSLFEDSEAAPALEAGLFAEVVFDRPLDHAYTYAVPSGLRDALTVGKRVQAPFGKGDRSTVGFCVGLSETGPERPVKEIQSVLDDEVLLTPDLLRLTRWMADYYLCGWGQVLNAVVPAGAKNQAGSRIVAFLEAVPTQELPQPAPAVTAKQAAALEQLRASPQPLAARQLARRARCGSG
ncbi:MAG: primosomal protein N', partial [Planctomycetes bacterium]|nr:primosomal protein N' [Planctomycetota bacterium]